MASRANDSEMDGRSPLRPGRTVDGMTSARMVAWALLTLLLCSLPAAWVFIARPDLLRAGRPRPALPDVTVEATPDPVNHDGQALLVTSLRSGAEAAREGIRVGDLIEGVDGRSVATVDELARALADDQNMVLTLHLRRGDHPLDMRLDRRAAGVANGT